MTEVKDMTGPELIEYIGQFPTLEVFLDRDPHAVPYTDEELLAQVKAERGRRAIANIKEEKARAKKQGIEEIESDDDKDTDN